MMSMLLSLIDPAAVDKATEAVRSMTWEGLIFLAVVIIVCFGLIWLWLRKDREKTVETVKKVSCPFENNETLDNIEKKINQNKTTLENLNMELIGIKATEARIEGDIVRVSSNLAQLIDKMMFMEK